MQQTRMLQHGRGPRRAGVDYCASDSMTSHSRKFTAVFTFALSSRGRGASLWRRERRSGESTSQCTVTMFSYRANRLGAPYEYKGHVTRNWGNVSVNLETVSHREACKVSHINANASLASQKDAFKHGRPLKERNVQERVMSEGINCENQFAERTDVCLRICMIKNSVRPARFVRR